MKPTLISATDRADHWDREADEAEFYAKRYAARCMDEEVAYYTEKARDCRDLAQSYRENAPAKLLNAAE